MNTKERIEEAINNSDLIGTAYRKEKLADQILALLEPKMSVLSEEEIVKIFQEVRELNGSDLDIIHALSGKIISAGRNAGKSTGSFGKAADTTIGGISKPQPNKVSIKIEPDAYISHITMINKINEIIERLNKE